MTVQSLTTRSSVDMTYDASFADRPCRELHVCDAVDGIERDARTTLLQILSSDDDLHSCWVYTVRGV